MTFSAYTTALPTMVRRGLRIPVPQTVQRGVGHMVTMNSTLASLSEECDASMMEVGTSVFE
jgi:hypothetical protein